MFHTLRYRAHIFVAAGYYITKGSYIGDCSAAGLFDASHGMSKQYIMLMGP